MQIIRKKTTLENLSFNILLTQDIKNLGLMEDISTNMLTKEQTTTIESIGSNKLLSVRSYDFTQPYKVGVNGVTGITGDTITYVIDGINHTTEKDTGDTIINLTKTDDIYYTSNFIRNENRLGLSDKIDFVNDVDIERPNISVIENFSILQQINNPDELTGFSNNFYNVYDESL